LFHHGLELPEFAAYDLLRDEPGYSILFDYYNTYIALANRENCQFVTADERMVNAIGAHFSNVVWVANWPVTVTPEESTE